MSKDTEDKILVIYNPVTLEGSIAAAIIDIFFDGRCTLLPFTTIDILYTKKAIPTDNKHNILYLIDIPLDKEEMVKLPDLFSRVITINSLFAINDKFDMFVSQSNCYKIRSKLIIHYHPYRSLVDIVSELLGIEIDNEEPLNLLKKYYSGECTDKELKSIVLPYRFGLKQIVFKPEDFKKILNDEIPIHTIITLGKIALKCEYRNFSKALESNKVVGGTKITRILFVNYPNIQEELLYYYDWYDRFKPRYIFVYEVTTSGRVYVKVSSRNKIELRTYYLEKLGYKKEGFFYEKVFDDFKSFKNEVVKIVNDYKAKKTKHEKEKKKQ